MFRVPFISCALVLAVVACAKNSPVDPKAAHAAALPETKVAVSSALGEPDEATRPAQPLPIAATKIPAAVRGRWGLTPAACFSPARDPKGLLVATADQFKFY